MENKQSQHPPPQIDRSAGYLYHAAIIGPVWLGLPTQGTLQFMQPDATLQIIRLLVSPFSANILYGTIILAWLFPLTREKYVRIQKLLEQRRERLAE